MREIKLSQGKIAKVDDADFEWLNQWEWSYSGHGYAHRNDKGKNIYMHKFITGWARTDHKNEDGLDNQRSNLRQSSVAENGRNRGKNKNNSSGFKGVSKQSRTNRFRAYIIVNRKFINLGGFKTKEEAAIAYNQGAIKYHGEFAKLNIINN